MKHQNILQLKWVLCALALVLCFSMQAYAREPFSIGKIFENKIILNNPDKSTIFLPPGKHEVASYYTTGNNQNMAVARLTLQKIGDDKTGKKIVKSGVSLLYNIQAGSSGWVESQLCDRNDLHFIDSKANYQNEQDCYGLNHYRPTLVGAKNKNIAAIGALLVERGIQLPQIMLLPFYRFADTYSLIQIFYFFNPEGYGFEAQERSVLPGRCFC